MTDKEPQPDSPDVAIENLILDKTVLVDQLKHIRFHNSSEADAFVLLGVPNQLVNEILTIFHQHQQSLIEEILGRLPKHQLTEENCSGFGQYDLGHDKVLTEVTALLTKYKESK